MALPRDYTGQTCSAARSLEVIGERWTLLIIRDAFYGVRRFRDFLAHLDIPRAVLSERLAALVEADIFSHDEGTREYVITDKGRDLWPVVRSLAAWGEKYYAPRGALRVFTHAGCGGKVDSASHCARCGRSVAPEDTVINPGPGLKRAKRRTDPVAVALAKPRRLLEAMPLD